MKLYKICYKMVKKKKKKKKKKDYKLFSTLININPSTEIEKLNTFFNSWNWEKKINQFWENGIKAYKSSYNLTKNSSSSQYSPHCSEDQVNIPLFAYVLAAYFLEDDEILNNNDNKFPFKILDNINKFSKEMKTISSMSYSKISEKKLEEDYSSSPIENRNKDNCNPHVNTNSKNDLNGTPESISTNSHNNSSNSIYTISTSKRRIKSASVYRSTGNLNNGANNSNLNERRIHTSYSSQSLTRKKSQTFGGSSTSLNNLYDSNEYQNDKQNIINSNQFKGFVITNDMMKPDFGSSRTARTPGNIYKYINLIRIYFIQIYYIFFYRNIKLILILFLLLLLLF